MITMYDISVVFKGLLLLMITWWTDSIIVKVVSLTFISPDIRQFFIEIKDIISVSVSLSILILTIIKIRSEWKKRNQIK